MEDKSTNEKVGIFINDVKGEILDEIGGELKNNNYNIIFTWCF